MDTGLYILVTQGLELWFPKWYMERKTSEGLGEE